MRHVLILRHNKESFEKALKEELSEMTKAGVKIVSISYSTCFMSTTLWMSCLIVYNN